MGVNYSNFGKLPSDKPQKKSKTKKALEERMAMRDVIKDNLKKNQAQIIGLSECEKEGEELRRAPGYAGDKEASELSLAYRDAYEYLTIRANLDA